MNDREVEESLARRPSWPTVQKFYKAAIVPCARGCGGMTTTTSPEGICASCASAELGGTATTWSWPEGAVGFLTHSRATDTLYFGPFKDWAELRAWKADHREVPNGGVNFMYLDVDWRR
jgi:hypothetical protein